MLNEQTIMKLQSMKLFGMSNAFRELIEKPKNADLSHAEFFGLIIDSEDTYRQNQRLERLLHNSKLKQPQACLEDLDYKTQRGLNKQMMAELSLGDWIKRHQAVLISGPTGVGKTDISNALGNSACRLGFTTYYFLASLLWNTLHQSRADGSYLKVLTKLSKYQVLLIDDLGLAPMTDNERKDFLEIVEERTLKSAMIIASQLPLKDWYQNIGDPTIADAICDRLFHNPYKIELKGESLRKKNCK